MIKISKVFRLKNNLIFAVEESVNIKIGDNIIDNKGNKYKVIGIPFGTHDLCVGPYGDINIIDDIQSFQLDDCTILKM